jgi:hypothetical protein
MRGVTAALRKLEPRWQFLLLLYAGLVWAHCLDLHWYVRRSSDFARWHIWHDNIIHARADYPDQYRPLTYWIAEIVYRVRLSFPWTQADTAYQTGVQFELAHLFVRFVFLLCALFLLHLFLRKWFSSPASAAGVIFIIAVLPLTVFRCSICVTDPLNLLVFVIGYWLIRDNKSAWLPAVVFVGMLNRETAGLLLLVHVFVNIGRPWHEWIPTAIAITASAAAAYFGLRVFYGHREPWAGSTMMDYLRVNFLEWHTWQMIGRFVGAWVLVAFKLLRSKPLFLRRCLWMFPFFFAGHAISGYIREVRYWLPLMPILLALALWSVWGPEERR